MKIDSLTVSNYRCIGKMELDEFPPITILVGRNNTGKSALLEAIALASTGDLAWYDSLGDDLLESIIEKRGGWKYADMMIKIGEQSAKIRAIGEDTSGTVEITKDASVLPDVIHAELSHGVSDYIDQATSNILRGITRRLERKSRPEYDMMQQRIREQTDAIKQKIWKLAKVYIGYYDEELERSEYAVVVGEQLEREFRELTRKIMAHEVLVPPISADEMIRSSTRGRSETIFLLGPSIGYLKALQRRLARSGDLLKLLDMMRDRIDYFSDIREVSNDFLVFVKGLERPVPLDAMGDGFRAKLAILSAIATLKKGVVLMEEPETRLHPGFMSSIINQIVETAAHGNLQYIISTHSLDFLELVLEENAGLVKVVRMYRIEEDSAIDYETMTGKEAQEQLKELKMDLRGV